MDSEYGPRICAYPKNNVGKEENIAWQHACLFSKCFQNTFFFLYSFVKFRLFGKELIFYFDHIKPKPKNP